MSRLRKILLIHGVLSFVLTLGSSAQKTVSAALKEADVELESALSQLDKTRAEIADEKPELAAEYEEVALQLREKRRLVRVARMARDDREMAVRERQRNLQVRRQDAAYLASLLKDHALKIQTVSGPGEAELEIDPEVIAREAGDPAAALEERLVVVGASLDRLEALLGGSQAPGKAASRSGEVVEGTFAAAGPLAWFSGGGEAGSVAWEKGGSLPVVVGGESKKVSSLIAGNETVLGLDVTGGKAQQLEEVDGGAVDLVRKGGLWIWPIIFLALLSLGFGLVKLVRFMKYREPGEAWVTAILAALRVGDREKASELATGVQHPAADVMQKLIETSANAADVVEETLYVQLIGVQQRASSLLPVIAVTAATAPLLGLLGTVSGMIRTFNLITVFGSGDPKPLAGGISEALVTTLFGLVVAVPALVLHAFLARRSQGIVQTTERYGLSFVNSLRTK